MSFLNSRSSEEIIKEATEIIQKFKGVDIKIEKKKKEESWKKEQKLKGQKQES